MSSLSNIYIKAETLQTLIDTIKKKGEKGINLTISINEDTDKFGNNLAGWVKQSKEQRDDKAPRYFVGNGECFWTDGSITKAERQDAQQAAPINSDSKNADDLPF